MWQAIKKWWADIWAEPATLGDPLTTDSMHRHPPVLFPDHARIPRNIFPAPAWSVPKDGPNEPGPSRAEQLFPQLVDYEWDVLFDAHGLETPSGEPIITGAAYNECCTFLAKSGATGLMGKPTQLGQDLIAMRLGRDLSCKRIDVV